MTNSDTVTLLSPNRARLPANIKLLRERGGVREGEGVREREIEREGERGEGRV